MRVGSAQEAEAIETCLEQVSLVSDADEIDGDSSQVMLMTIHAAKGLEFPAVFIIGMEDGVFPHLRSIGEPDELEEERRLAYVALTRAQERLYLSHRSEEHTSELQSLMRISYAVFCLKK